MKTCQGKRVFRRRGERGSVAPVFLVTVSILLIMGWTMAAVASAHYLQVAHQSGDIMAGELAKAGLAAAMAELDAHPHDPAGSVSGTEETGAFETTITPTDRGTYTVVSTGTAKNRSRQITAEVAPPPDPFVVLAGGNVQVDQSVAVSLGGIMKVDGDINAGGDVSLSAGTLALSVGKLEVDGNIRAKRNADLTATAIFGAVTKLKVNGDVSAGKDVSVTTDGLGKPEIQVDGSVEYGGRIDPHEDADLGSVDLGSKHRVDGVAIPEMQKDKVEYYEALVDSLADQMVTVDPDDACGTISKNTRVTGDLDCTNLKIKDGAFVVVDGSVDVWRADVGGTLYVRGGSTPNSGGDVDIDTLALLELVGTFDPVKGSGTVVATGNVHVGKSGLAELLSFLSDTENVLQVVTLSTGPEDHNNDIDFGLGGIIEGLSYHPAPPLFLYAGDDGDIQLKLFQGIGLLRKGEQPVITVAGGDVNIKTAGLAEVVSEVTIEAWPEIWEQVPPFLQDLGKSRVVSWQWTDE